MANIQLDDFSWDSVIGAAKAVEQRLLRACATLDAAEVPYAVVGEQAARYWISQVDPAAVRNTPAVEIVVRRCDLSAAGIALESNRFVGRREGEKHLFLESADAQTRHAVEILIAEPPESAARGYRTDDVSDAAVGESFRVVSLDALVRAALGSFRLIDRVCLRDLADVGLVDDSWCDRLPDVLAQRLRGILETPEG